MNYTQNSRYSFHGTLAAGKSHLLVALACLLMREGKIAVYIADRNELLVDPAEYFRSAVEFASYGCELNRSHLKGPWQEADEEHIAHGRLSGFCRGAP